LQPETFELQLNKRSRWQAGHEDAEYLGKSISRSCQHEQKGGPSWAAFLFPASDAEVNAALVVLCNFVRSNAENTQKQPCHKSAFGTILVG
jgi:hypothetical protein